MKPPKGITEEQHEILLYLDRVFGSCETREHCKAFFSWVCRKIDREEINTPYHSILNMFAQAGIGKSIQLVMEERYENN